MDVTKFSNQSPKYVYHCTTLKNLFYILKMKEPKLMTFGKVIQKAMHNNLDVRNSTTNFYKKENVIALSPHKMWMYGGICFKIRMSKLNKKYIKWQSPIDFLFPGKFRLKMKTELLYFDDIRLSQIEEIYYNPIIEYITGIFPTILMILGGVTLVILMANAYGVIH